MREYVDRRKHLDCDGVHRGRVNADFKDGRYRLGNRLGKHNQLYCSFKPWPTHETGTTCQSVVPTASSKNSLQWHF